MTRAAYRDKDLVVNILANSFADNLSVNYIIKQDSNKLQRIKGLMAYSFEICHLYGDVFLTDDRKGCALIVFPDKKKTAVKSILLDVKLIFKCMGLLNIKKAMRREAMIKNNHPEGPMYYLWFIGVDATAQNKGIGSKLLEYVINQGISQNRKICLETSTLKNIPWYQKFGFEIYKELDFGYKLYCMKKE